ncbi:MAG: hypothetical protein JW910_22765 [Anaerolineae bacterium]|nr:hypothetical protein [Anaerolineae bacterium]
MMSYTEARLHRLIILCTCITLGNTIGVTLGWWGDGLTPGHIATACIVVICQVLALDHFRRTHKEQ